jgi:NDP-sugar pyrophosphorylase family protein
MASEDNFTSVVLCGGRGARMGDRTQEIPKPLVSVIGKPILQHILIKLDDVGFDQIVLCTGYKSSKIEESVDVGELSANTPMVVNDTGEGTAMLARIVQSRHLFQEYVVVCYGDTFIDLDFNQLIQHHIDEQRKITIVTGKIKNPFGILTLDEQAQTVISFVEKPVYDYYIGCFIFKATLLDEVSPEQLEMPDGAGLVDLFQNLIDRQEMHFHRFDGMQVTFNTELEREDAEKTLSNYYTISNE